VTGDAQSAVEDLDRGGGEADVHLLTHQLIGNAVVVPLGRDMIIESDLERSPLPQLVGFGRKWTQGQWIESSEQTGARTLSFAERLLIQADEQFCDGRTSPDGGICGRV
jgi:hypothetical protein